MALPFPTRDVFIKVCTLETLTFIILHDPKFSIEFRKLQNVTCWFGKFRLHGLNVVPVILLKLLLKHKAELQRIMCLKNNLKWCLYLVTEPLKNSIPNSFIFQAYTTL